MDDTDQSVQDWRNHLLNSLKGTGRLDMLKGLKQFPGEQQKRKLVKCNGLKILLHMSQSQLRARLVDQLRDHDGMLLEFKGNRKPSFTERILTSLFLDYLRAYGFSFTQSVFLPESQAVSWPAFTFQEMSQLLHLDPTTSCHSYLKIGPREKGCLAQQLVMVLQQMPFRIRTQDSSTQTSHQDPQDLDGCLREIDETCFQNKVSESRMTFRTLEERLNTFRQEFETRVNAEVALQVSRIREYETSAVRLDEEGRYRRQLAREREELKQTHKTRLERIREREESRMEQLVMKEKAIETSAYEQRQKLLASITDLRDREDRVRDKEDQQRRIEDALEEKGRMLRMKEADIAQREETIHAQAGSDAQMKIKSLEEQCKTYQEQLQSQINLLEAEREAYREDKARLGNDLAAVKSDRDLVHSLNERLASDEKRRTELMNSLLERLASEEEQKKFSLKTIEDVCSTSVPQQMWNLLQSYLVWIQEIPSRMRAPILAIWRHGSDQVFLLWGAASATLFLGALAPLCANLMLLGACARTENTTELCEDRTLDNCCKICQQQHRRWARDRKKTQEIIKQLEKAVQEAEDAKERANQARRAIQLQLQSSDSELLETVSLLKKTQHALELERLHHYTVRSQIASVFSLPSHDKFQHQSGVTPVDPSYALTNGARLKTGCGYVPAMKDVGTAKYIEGDQREDLSHHYVSSSQQPTTNVIPCTNETKCYHRDLSLVGRPPATRVHQVDTALTCHKEETVSSDSNSETHSSCTKKDKGMIVNQSTSPCQLDGFAAVGGLGGEHSVFHQGRTVVKSSLESSGCISDMHKKKVSEKQIGGQVGRSNQGEPESSCHQNIPGTDTSALAEAPQLPVKMKRRQAGLEAKRTASADFQEMSQSRKDHYVLETHSKRSSNSEPIPVNTKTAQHSSYSDNTSEERVLTNIDIIEMKFEKKKQGSRRRDTASDPNNQQKVASSAPGYCQEPCDIVNEVYKSKLITLTGRGGSNALPVSRDNGVLNLASVDSQKSMLAHRNDMSELDTNKTEFRMKRPLGDQALYKLSCQSKQDEARPCPSDNRRHVFLRSVGNDEERGDEKEAPTHNEPKPSLSNPASSPERIHKESYGSELSKPASPAGNMKCDLRQWLTDNIGMDMDFHDDRESLEHINEQQKKVSMPYPAEASQICEDLTKPASRQPLDSEELKRITQQQQGGDISISHHVGPQAQCRESKSSSTKQVSAVETAGSFKKTDILGGASSVESSSNPTKRTSSAKNGQEASSNPIQATLKETPYETNAQRDQSQNADEGSGRGSRVQSEQGSYSPGEGNVEWIDDLPTAASDNYVDNSDAFNSDIPESDSSPSGKQSSK